MGISSWSLKVKDPAELPNDPPELPIAWLVGGAQASTMSGLASGEGSGRDALQREQISATLMLAA